MRVFLVLVVAGVFLAAVALLYYQQYYAEQCDAKGGAMTGFVKCKPLEDSTAIASNRAASVTEKDVALMKELFEKKYYHREMRFIDGMDYSRTEIKATNPHGGYIVLATQIQDGRLSAEIICKHNDWRGTEVITENLLDYMKNENCFMPAVEETWEE